MTSRNYRPELYNKLCKHGYPSKSGNCIAADARLDGPHCPHYWDDPEGRMHVVTCPCNDCADQRTYYLSLPETPEPQNPRAVAARAKRTKTLEQAPFVDVFKTVRELEKIAADAAYDDAADFVKEFAEQLPVHLWDHSNAREFLRMFAIRASCHIRALKRK